MNLTWQKSESLVQPLALDKNLSNTAIYIRKNIEVTETENESGETVTKYTYDEATITPAEYSALGDNDAEVLYELALDTPVTYPANGHIYLPRYIDDYDREMDKLLKPLLLITLIGGDVSTLFPDIAQKTVNIYDATRLKENKVSMNISQLTQLFYFLYFQKEERYNAYRETLDELL